MKKQLTKTQIENRKKILNKVKNIILYCSLAFNLLVGVCLAISGCSSSSNSSRSTTINSQESTNLLLPKKQLRNQDTFETYYDDGYFNDTSIWKNDNACGFDLYYPKSSSPNRSWIINFDITADTYYVVVNSGVTFDYDHLYVYIHQSPTTQIGDYIECATSLNNQLGLYRAYYWTSSNTYTTYSTPFPSSQFYGRTPDYDSSNGFVVLFNKAYLTSVGLSTYNLLNAYFNELSYYDYDLSNNWSPYAYYDSLTYGVYLNYTINRLDYIILDSALSVNGYIYTDLIVDWDTVSNDTIYLRVQGQEEIRLDNSSVSYISSVYFYNRFTDRALQLWSFSWGVTNNSHVSILYPNSAKFWSYDRTKIRLFDVNPNVSVLSGYFNSNSLSATYYYDVSDIIGNTASNNTIFGLFKLAFSSLSGIFSVTILPGITIGVLLFLPLVALVILSVIRLVKK